MQGAEREHQDSTCHLTNALDRLITWSDAWLVSFHVSISYVPADLLWAGPGWSPEYFLGAPAMALRAGVHGHTISDMGGRVHEGWRVSETPGTLAYDPRAADTPIYRQGNIGTLRLMLGPEHWASPRIRGSWCVQPGDVVVNKFPPVRAAIVPPGAKRHPVDGNTLLVRGLGRSDALWLCWCLNQPCYEQLLLAGSGLLKRVGLGALASLRIPPTPREMWGLSARLQELLEASDQVGDGLHRMREEAQVEAMVDQGEQPDLSVGAFFPQQDLSNDNWLPTATALRAEQAHLGEALGWVPLTDWVTFGERARLGQTQEGIRCLRLSDVGDDLFPDGALSFEFLPSRTMATALLPGDVLLSTTGTGFRSAYVDEGIPPRTHPVDGWVRLRCRETPAALALLLSTESMRSQIARLAIGSVQQFVPQEALNSVRIPVPAREVRERWQSTIERLHDQRRTIERHWAALVGDLSNVFESIHRPFSLSVIHAKEGRT